MGSITRELAKQEQERQMRDAYAAEREAVDYALGKDGPTPPSAGQCAALANLLDSADAGLITASDAVVLPGHYARFKIEPIRFIGENRLNFFQGNILKYVMRYDAKNGIEDLKKARRYLDMFIRYLDGDEDWWKKPTEARDG